MSIAPAPTVAGRSAARRSSHQQAPASAPGPETAAQPSGLVIGPEDYTALILALYHFPPRLGSPEETPGRTAPVDLTGAE